MINLLTWFAGTRIGRWLLGAFGLIGAVALIAWRAFAKGKAAARAKRQEATIDAIEDRRSSDADIDHLSDAAVRERMQDRWSR